MEAIVTLVTGIVSNQLVKCHLDGVLFEVFDYVQ